MVVAEKSLMAYPLHTAQGLWGEVNLELENVFLQQTNLSVASAYDRDASTHLGLFDFGLSLDVHRIDNY